MKPYYEDTSVKLFLGDCREVLPELDIVDHVLTDPPYSRDVYQRLSGPKTHAGSGTPARLGNHRKDILNGRSGKAQGVNHQYSSMSIEKLAAGAIGQRYPTHTGERPLSFAVYCGREFLCYSWSLSGAWIALQVIKKTVC